MNTVGGPANLSNSNSSGSGSGQSPQLSGITSDVYVYAVTGSASYGSANYVVGMEVEEQPGYSTLIIQDFLEAFTGSSWTWTIAWTNGGIYQNGTVSVATSPTTGDVYVSGSYYVPASGSTPENEYALLMEFSPSGTPQGTVAWQMNNPSAYGHFQAATSLAISPDGNYVFVASNVYSIYDGGPHSGYPSYGTVTEFTSNLGEIATSAAGHLCQPDPPLANWVTCVYEDYQSVAVAADGSNYLVFVTGWHAVDLTNYEPIQFLSSFLASGSSLKETGHTDFAQIGTLGAMYASGLVVSNGYLYVAGHYWVQSILNEICTTLPTIVDIAILGAEVTAAVLSAGTVAIAIVAIDLAQAGAEFLAGEVIAKAIDGVCDAWFLNTDTPYVVQFKMNPSGLDETWEQTLRWYTQDTSESDLINAIAPLAGGGALIAGEVADTAQTPAASPPLSGAMVLGITQSGGLEDAQTIANVDSTQQYSAGGITFSPTGSTFLALSETESPSLGSAVFPATGTFNSGMPGIGYNPCGVQFVSEPCTLGNYYAPLSPAPSAPTLCRVGALCQFSGVSLLQPLSLSLSTQAGSVVTGSSVSTIASISGFPEGVTLTVGGLPAGASPQWVSNPIQSSLFGIGDQLTITTLNTTPPGVYPLTVTATIPGSTWTASARYTLTVSNPTDTVSFTTSPSIGSTSPSGSNTYAAGTTVPVYAIAVSGYEFTSWKSSNPAIVFACSSCDATTATVWGSGTVTANFATSPGLGTIIQSCYGQSVGATSAFCSLPTAVSAGDLLVVEVADVATPTVTDSPLGDHFALINSAPLFGSTYSLYVYATLVTTTSPDLITVTGSGNYPGIVVHDMTGVIVGPLSSTGTGSSATPSVQSYTPPALDFVLAAAVLQSTDGLIPTSVSPGAGYSLTTLGWGIVDEATIGSGSPTTSPFDLGSSLDWGEVSIALTPAATEMVSATVQEAGAPAATFTLSGCGVSPTTILGDGTPHPVTAMLSCSVTITVPTAGSNSKYLLSGGLTSTTFPVCPPSSCPGGESLKYYYQLDNTYQISPVAPPVWDKAYSLAVSGESLGASVTLCTIGTIAGGGSANCSGWGDYGKSASFPNVAGSYYAQSSTTFTDTTGGNTHSVSFDIEGSVGQIVQTCANMIANPLGSESTSCTLSSSVTRGHLIVVEAIELTAYAPTISDSFGEQFQEISSASLAGSTYSLYFFVASAGGSGPDKIVVSGIGEFPALLVHEVSGVTSVSAFSTGTGTSNAPSVAAYSPTAGTLVLAGLLVQNSLGVVSATVSAGAGYNLLTSAPGYLDEMATASGSATTSPFSLSSSLGYAEVSVAFSSAPGGPVTLPISLTVQETGAPAATFTLSGCSVTPTTIVGDGTIHDVTAVPNCQLTVSVPADQANSRYRFGGGNPNTPIETCSFLTCASSSLQYYYQLENMYRSTPESPSTWNGVSTISVSGTSLGSPATICSVATAAGGGAVSCAGWSDYGTTASLTPTTYISNEKWTGQAPTSFTDTSGGNTHTVDYTAAFLVFTTGQNASLVIGAPNFTTDGFGTGPSSFESPSDMVFDSHGNLWVADVGNFRVLEFTPPFTTGMSASLVIGQANLYDTGYNPVSQYTVGEPIYLAFDSHGDLWVVDSYDNRILEFVPPFSDGMAASLEIGQPNFGSRISGDTSSTFGEIEGLAFSPSGNLWVADAGNNRVLEFSSPFSDGEAASLVIGQAGFNTGSAGSGLNNLDEPHNVAFDSQGDLWVADYWNDRVVEFAPPFSDGMAATMAIGGSTGPISWPTAVAFDASGNLWVTTEGTDHALEFTAPFTSGMSPSVVIGVSGFTSTGTTIINAGTLINPQGLTFDSQGDLWVADYQDSRVLEYVPTSVPVVPVVTLPLSLTAQETGAPTATFTLSGCSVTPTTIVGDGTIHDVTAVPNCQLTVSVPADQANSRYRFGGGQSSLALETCSSGTCATASGKYYYQVQNTYQAVPSSPTSWDGAYSVPVSGTLLGSSVTLCTIATTNGGGTAACTAWSDADTTVSFPTTVSSWSSQGPTSFAQGNTGGAVYSADYTMTVSMCQVAMAVSPEGAGSTVPSVGTQEFACGTEVNISATAASGYVFSGWVSTGPITIVSASSPMTDAIATGAGTITADFVVGTVTQPLILDVQESGAPPATFTLSGCGVSPTSIVGDNAVYDVTAATSCAITISPPAPTTSTRYLFASGATATVETCASDSPGPASCGTQSLDYYYQVQNTYEAYPASPTSWDGAYSVPVSGTLLGSAVTLCTIETSNGGGAATCTAWSDGDTYVSFPTTVGSWSSQGTTSFGQGNYGNQVYTVDYTMAQQMCQVAMGVSPEGAGSTTPAVGTQEFACGTEVPIDATAASGYVFSSWVPTGPITIVTPSSASTDAIATGAGTITANFVPTVVGGTGPQSLETNGYPTGGSTYVCYTEGYYYVFYTDDNTPPGYSYPYNGYEGYVSSASGQSGTWSSETIIPAIPQNTLDTAAIYCDGSGNVYMAWRNLYADPGMYFMEGVASGGSIAWGPDVQLESQPYTPESIYAFSPTNVWLAYTYLAQTGYVGNCDASSCTAASNWSVAYSSSTYVCGYGCYIYGFGSPSNVGLAVSVSTGGAYQEAVIYTENSGSSWTVGATSSDVWGINSQSSCVTVSTTLYCGVESAGEKGQDFIYYTLGGSWTVGAVANFGGYVSGALEAVSTDGTNLVFAFSDSNENYVDWVYTKSLSPISWSSEGQISTEEDGPIYGGAITYGLQSTQAGLMWVDQGGSDINSTVRFALTPSLTAMGQPTIQQPTRNNAASLGTSQPLAMFFSSFCLVGVQLGTKASGREKGRRPISWYRDLATMLGIRPVQR